MLPCTSRACSWRRKDRWKKDMVEKAKRSQSGSAKMWILQAKNRDRLLFPVCSMGWCDWNKVKVVSIGGCSIVPNSCTFCHYHCGCSWKIPLVVGYMLLLFRYSITRCIISCYVFSKPSSNPVLQQLGKGHRFGNAQVQLRFALQAASFRRWTNNWMSNAVSKIDVYDSWVPWAAGLASSLRAYVVMHSECYWLTCHFHDGNSSRWLTTTETNSDIFANQILYEVKDE